MSRRTEIIRRAGEVFQRQGIARTSIEDIAKAVGIKREGVYYYFKSRQEIVLEVILPQSRALLENLHGILGSDITSLKKLNAAIRSHLDSFNPSYLEMSVALREHHFGYDDEKLSELRSVWKKYSDGWTRLVREGQERGEFTADYNPKVMAYGILGLCNWLSRWFDPAKEITLDEIIETYSRLITCGICSEPYGAQPDAPPTAAVRRRNRGRRKASVSR